ncbi:hypothetical protein [Maridesulfovibrio hydrothermalis]|uniref:Uncharacterized protein n=1 Tax=Maridesulfovibrio hydrothermalis AM13 = DSM 14728 TaxID=1121451 RepID=L0R9U0_9BACT|nr:hypothetical protein [Maridesulfovibrio hydrothermalis]CCO23548.1 conserved protein of unknown function [Maridesulfovibrio hydrothermalis AM13 = DSM 14728]
MKEAKIRTYIHKIIMNKCLGDEDARQDALGEFIALTMPNIDEGTVKNIKSMIPPIADLYEKWATMFIDRLLETVPRNQIEELCSGTAENDSALVLIYIMFMESERMEKQVEEDISSFAPTQNDEAGNLASSFIRSKLSLIAEEQKNTDTRIQ